MRSRNGLPQPACAHVWGACLTGEEREVYRRAGYHEAFGLGAHPAIVVIDVEYNFTGDVSEPILDSIRKYPNSCGPNAWQVMPAIAAVVARARVAGVPIVFTHGVNDSAHPTAPRQGTAIVDALPREQSDHVLGKEAASAFFETGLAKYLRDQGVDTLLHLGCTTSGCVRATVVDAAAYGFRNAVVEGAVFDRAMAPHRSSLFDMDAKYADVMSVADAERYLTSLALTDADPRAP